MIFDALTYTILGVGLVLVIVTIRLTCEKKGCR